MGKALVLKRMLEFLREKHHGADDVIITAPTGIAAIPIGGTTIHRAAGIGHKVQMLGDFRKMWNEQVIFAGDIFQLPPGDREFIRMLNGIRTGQNPAALEEIVKLCARDLHEADRSKPTVLFPKNDAADDYLLTELNALSDAVVESDVLWIDPERQLQQIVLDAVDKIVIDEPENPDFNLHRQQYIQLEGALKHCLALKEITLKVGAQVRHLNS